jgi:hypothetical protein
VVGRPVVDNRLVYFVSFDNVLRALDKNTGNQRWKRALPIRPTRGLVVMGETLIASGVSPSATVFAMKDGAPLGSLGGPGELATAPHVVTGEGLPIVLLVSRDLTKGTILRAVTRAIEPQVLPMTPLPNPTPRVSDYVQLTTAETPPTQAQCNSAGRRCFTPQSTRASYNLNSLYAAGIDGRGVTIALERGGARFVWPDLDAPCYADPTAAVERLALKGWRQGGMTPNAPADHTSPAGRYLAADVTYLRTLMGQMPPLEAVHAYDRALRADPAFPDAARALVMIGFASLRIGLAPEAATAFGLRRDHLLIEIIALLDADAGPTEEERHWCWVRATMDALSKKAIPGGYANLLARDCEQRAAQGFGKNATRLAEAKRRYDPDNVFRSAIPIPASR